MVLENVQKPKSKIRRKDTIKIRAQRNKIESKKNLYKRSMKPRAAKDKQG